MTINDWRSAIITNTQWRNKNKGSEIIIIVSDVTNELCKVIDMKIEITNKMTFITQKIKNIKHLGLSLAILGF